MSKTSIPNNSTIFRAILASSWTNENDEATPTAFLLKPKDDGKLSILTKADCSIEFCQGGFNTCYGEILLNSSKVKELNLELRIEPLPYNPYHAVILGLPLPENIAERERMATLLVERVEEVRRKRPPFKRPK